MRRRQNFKCFDCGVSETLLENVLDVHHKVPFHNFQNAKAANKLTNLVALCRACHAKADAAIEHRQTVLGLLVGDEIRPGKARGERNKWAKMTADMVVAMRQQRAAGASIKALCAKFPVTATAAQYICAGKSWRHVGGPLSRGRKYGGASGPAGII